MGILVVFEGLDGAGKGTQLEHTKRRIERAGLVCESLSFPRYGESFYADIVGRYLSGEFGEPLSVSPYLSSLPYAVDRLQAREAIRGWLEEGRVVLLDRYVGSNLAHQGAKLEGDKAQAFVRWLATLEYEVNGMPTEDLTILLDAPPQVSFARVAQKRRRRYTRRRRDLHEKDMLYQHTVHEQYKLLASEFANWVTIECLSPEGGLLPEDAINEKVVAVLNQRLSFSLQ